MSYKGECSGTSSRHLRISSIVHIVQTFAQLNAASACARAGRNVRLRQPIEVEKRRLGEVIMSEMVRPPASLWAGRGVGIRVALATLALGMTGAFSATV